MTISGAFCENNYLYFYSNSFDCNGLYRFNLDNNELKLIHEDLCWMISVNSLLKKDNYIYSSFVKVYTISSNQFS